MRGRRLSIRKHADNTACSHHMKATHTPIFFLCLSVIYMYVVIQAMVSAPVGRKPLGSSNHQSAMASASTFKVISCANDLLVFKPMYK